ncbi:MAG: HNH endonuclease signature motif containing protein [Spirosomataceae bacterium]
MSRYVADSLRKSVAERANFCFEYCLLPSENSYFSFHIEHIVSLKHGGKTEIDNLTYSCQICNLNKGTDLGTFLDNPVNLVRFFNPRTDRWSDHFEILSTGFLRAKTEIGEATIKILDLNHLDSITERLEMI